MSNIRFMYHSFKISTKLAFNNKVAFFLMLIATTLKHGLFLAIWKFFFDKYSVINSWNFSNLLFMYGQVFIAIGVVESFFYGLREIPKYVETGQLDVFLIQPRNLLLNIAISKSDPEAFGEIIIGLVFIYFSGYAFNSLSTSISVIFIILLGILFMFSLLLYLSTSAFFIRNSRDFVRELSLNSFIIATNPNSAYKGLLKIIICTVLPVAYLSFFPVEYIRTGNAKFLTITVFGTLIFFIFAYILFMYGVKKYESGNVISIRR